MNLFERFEVLEDPRDIRGKRYKLIDILIMTIYAILCGQEDYVSIADFMELKKEYFTELLGLENGTPSHDCLSDLYARIDSKKFMEIFINWTKELIQNKTNKIISIDGKAIKSATDKINGGNIPYIVSAFLGDIGLSIGQVQIGDKSNEITAIPELLDLIDIKDSIITIDAIGTQVEIINKIVSKKGHYVLKVKDNQKELKKNIKKYFHKQNNLYGNQEIEYLKTTEKDHGRIEIREYFLSYNIETIEDKERWKAVKAIAYVKVQTIIGEELKVTENYYISDYQIEINKMEEVIREHWNIECGLHWRLDVIMNEDHSRNRIGNSINNLSILRKIVFNLASLDTSFGKVPLKRKLTRYTLDFNNIERLIFEIIPTVNCQ